MKFLCIESMTAHWGSIFTKGKEYEVIREHIVDVSVVTNNKEYWSHISMISQSAKWIQEGHSKDRLHKVMPGYKNLSEVYDLYTKEIPVLHYEFRADDDSVKSFCTLTDSELFILGVDVSDNGKPAFNYTVYQLDDYFDTKSIRRDNKLKELGI